MSKINFNITNDDRNIARLFPDPNLSVSSDQPIGKGNDKATEGLMTLINLLKELSATLDDSTKKVKNFQTEAEKIAEGAGKTPSTNLFQKNIDSLKELKSMDKLFPKMSEMFNGLTEIFASDKATANIMKWAKGFADMGNSLIKGDPIGAIGSAGKVISSMINANRQAKKEIKKFYDELERAAIDYSIKAIAASKDIKSNQDSIFDTDTANKLAKGMTGYNDAQVMLDKLYNRLGSETIQTGKKKRKFLGVTTGTKTYWGDVLSNYKKILNTDKELLDTTTGKLDMSVANSLLDSGKLSGEASKTLKEMIDVQNAADAAMKQVNDTLSSMSGTLGTDLQTALVSAFRDGTDAADEFGKSVSQILENIITDQMFNIVFGEELKKLEKRMQDSYSEGGDQDITDDIAWFYKTYTSGVEKFNQGLSQMKEQVSGMTGLDILGSKQTNTPTQSTSKGYSVSMNQETGGAILSRVTGLHETGLRLESELNTMLGIQVEKNNLFAEQSNQLLQLCSVNVQSMYHLEDINKNTKQLYQINDRLGAIEQNTSRL